MAKSQNSKNPIRDGQNVGRVPISMGDGFKNPNGDILDQNPLDTNFLGKLDPRPVDPGCCIGPCGCILGMPPWALMQANSFWKTGGASQPAGVSASPRSAARKVYHASIKVFGLWWPKYATTTKNMQGGWRAATPHAPCGCSGGSSAPLTSQKVGLRPR